MDSSEDYDTLNNALHSRPESVTAYRQAVDHGLKDDEAAAIIRYFAEDGARVLDIGCGAGRTTGPLAELGFDVVGIDVSEPMVHEAQSLVPNVPFITSDVSALGFHDAVFEYALFSYNGLDLLWPEQKRHNALREIYRVLKPGGIFIFSTRNAWHLPAVNSPFDLRSWVHSVLLAGYRLLTDRFTTHYKETNVGLWTSDWNAQGVSYFSNPIAQKQQLRDHGFQVLDILGGYFATDLHFVTWKPVE